MDSTFIPYKVTTTKNIKILKIMGSHILGYFLYDIIHEGVGLVH
jgi:hypothetical protein